jgi:hypothetical protein
MARISRLALIGVFVLLGSSVLAGITSISYTPDPIVVGQATVYTANCTPQPFKYEWDYRCTQGQTGAWVPSPPETTSTNTKTDYESQVGSFDVRCKAYYQGSGNPPPPPTTSTSIKSVTVNGPDSDTITAGLNTESTGYPAMTLTVKFQVRSGATAIGIHTDGYPQERIRRPQSDFDSGWVDPSSNYYFNGSTGEIIDVKVVQLGWLWSNIAIGEVFDDFYQQNRMVIRDCFYNQVYYSFSERHFQKVKSAPYKWKLVQVQ